MKQTTFESYNKILVVIPAYNEEKDIGSVIANIRQVLPMANVLVINDGSKDNTATKAKVSGAIVVSHFQNMGYGIALQTGYKYAQMNGYEYILQIDADGQHTPNFLQDILNELISSNIDIVIGSRFLHRESYKPPIIRRIGIVIFSFLASMMIRQKITDPTSGFRGYKRSVLNFLVSDYFPVDYPDADVIVMCHRYGHRIKEIPVIMNANTNNKSMHSGIKPLYYIFKITFSLFLTLLRKF